MTDARTEVREVVMGRRRDRADFVALPFRLARRHPHWHPGLRRVSDELLDPSRNPFWSHGTGSFFLVRKGSRVAGRMAVLDPGAWPSDPGAAVLAFPDFEDDPDVFLPLLEAVERRARERGARRLVGPFNPDIHHDVGILVEGHGLQNAAFMGYHPPHYARAFEEAGFLTLRDFHAWYLSGERFWKSPRMLRLVHRVERHPELRIRHLDLGRFPAELRLFHDLYCRCFIDHWGFSPPTWEEFEFLAGDLRYLLRGRMAVVAEWRDEPVGFALGIPDIHQAIPRDAGGRLTPGLVLRTLLRWRSMTSARVMIAGVLPEHRKRGLHLPIFHRVGAGILECGFQGAEVSWIVDRNRAMSRAMELMGGERTKTYRTFVRGVHQ